MLHLRLSGLQLLNPFLKLGLLSAGVLLLRLQLLLQGLLLLLQFRLGLLVFGQFGFQLAPALRNFTGLLLNLFPTLGLFSQRLGHLLELLFQLGLCGL